MQQLFKHTCLFILLIVATMASGQYVHGKLTDEKGLPLAYASVYVKNSTRGVSADQKGYYFLELESGKHTVVFSFIGYVNQEFEVTILPKEPIRMDLSLSVETNTLFAAEVVANTTDMAKEIMENVRDKRKYYLDRVSEYSCETYLKTSLEKELMRPSKKDLEEADSLETKDKSIQGYFKKEKLNLIETVSTTYFRAPDRYKEIVSAHHDYAERPGEGDPGRSVHMGSGMEFGKTSIAPVTHKSDNPYILFEDFSKADLNFYQNLVEFPAVSHKPLLSPLASNGGLSYRYDYLGSFVEDGKRVYEIEVNPLFKSGALFKGKIFVEDSTWAVVTVDLSINPDVLIFCKEFRVIQNYMHNENDQVVPVRRELTYTIKDGRHDILGNTRVDHHEYNFTPDLARGFFNAEIKEYTTNAFDRDSSFWADRRPLVLKETELKFISESDSISEYYASDEYYDLLDSAFNIVDWWTPLVGFGRKNSKKGTEFYLEGVLSQVNPFGIGGYRHKLPGYFNKEFKNDYLLETEGFIDYGFRNKDVKGKLGVGLTYYPEKFVRTFIRAGETYDLINNYASIEQTFSRSNYAKTRMASIAQRMEIVNGLFAELTFEYMHQSPLNANDITQWSNDIFGELNTPLVFDPYVKSEIKLELKYRFRQKFVQRGREKMIIGSDYPEINAIYRKGIPGLFNSEVNFDYFEISMHDHWNLGQFGYSKWQVVAGSFLNKNNLRILEWKFFRGSDRYFFSDPVNSFQLLGPTMSTPNEYFSANYIHHFDGALLNKVPLIRHLKLSLATGAGTLLIPDSDFAHFEAYLGLEKAIRIKKQLFRISVYAVTSDNSFNSTNYTWKIGFNFFNTFTKKWEY
jgi:hypothetical protein